MGEFKFEAFGSGKKGKKEDKQPTSPEEGGLELEKATNIKKEISEITQGRSLDNLSQDDLNAVLAKYKEMKIALGILETEPKGEVREQMLRAQEIMGEDFFAAEQIEKAFGIKVRAEDIPSIPFKRAELERAKELNQFLILRVDKTNDGKPLTIAKMNELLKGKIKDGTTALFSDDGLGGIKDDAWYKDEDFALKETPKLSWALTSKEVIPNSSGKNYLEQTIEIVNYLKNEVFKGKEIPTEFQNAIAEFETAKDEIAKLIGDDWQQATEKLEKLAITKLTRQMPVEALYDIVVYFQNKGERLLENTYTWTSRRGSRGELVDVGSFDADGALVYRSTPGNSSDDLGVAFSRSL